MIPRLSKPLQQRLAFLAAGLALVGLLAAAVACGGDNESSTSLAPGQRLGVVATTVQVTALTKEVGGSDIGLVRLIEALGRERYEAVVALPAEGPMTPLLNAAGARVHVLPMMQLRTLPSLSYQSRYLARMWPTVRDLAALIRAERADLVHTNSLYCLYGGFAARVARTPHVWHVREIPPAIPVARPALGRMVLALSRMVIATVSFTMRAIRAMTASCPSLARVGSECRPCCREPSADMAQTTMLVPPRSTPTMN